MKKIILICPYFGKFPKYQFPLWLQSCKYNNTIDWLIITDDTTSYDYPKNVKVVYQKWEAFRERIQSNFDFTISLERPYKLCDFKPLYGFIFNKEIEGYDFWGYTDISDTIYGDLRKYLTNEILTGNDKVMFLGHFTLFKNTKEVNEAYKLSLHNSMSYKEVLSTDKSMLFDELRPYAINRIFKDNGFSIANINDLCFDILRNGFTFKQAVFSNDWRRFYDPTGRRYCLQWDNGRLYTYYLKGLKLIREERGYVHLQKRKMTGSVRADSPFLIVPDRFVRTPYLFNMVHFVYYAYLCPLLIKLKKTYICK